MWFELILLYKTKNTPLRYVFLTTPLADSHTDCLQSLAVLKDLFVVLRISQLRYICQRQIVQISVHNITEIEQLNVDSCFIINTSFHNHHYVFE